MESNEAFRTWRTSFLANQDDETVRVTRHETFRYDEGDQPRCGATLVDITTYKAGNKLPESTFVETFRCMNHAKHEGVHTSNQAKLEDGSFRLSSVVSWTETTEILRRTI